VELDEKEKKCPLCNTPVCNPDDYDYKDTVYTVSRAKERASVRYYRNRYTNITGFCIFTVMAILTIINLSINGKVSWSIIPLLNLALLWFLMVFPVRNAGKIQTVTICNISIIVTSGFLIIIDALTSFKSWSLIVLFSALTACIGVSLPLQSKLKTKNIITFTALSFAIYLIIIDYLTKFSGWSLYSAGGIALAWSFTLLPMYIKRKYSTIGTIFFDSILLLVYLYFSLTANGMQGKFSTFALPLVVSLSIPVMSVYLLFKRYGFSVFGILSMCFFFAAIVALICDRVLNINIYMDGILFHEWAIITSACCFAVSVFLFLIEKNSNLKAFLVKKLNI